MPTKGASYRFGNTKGANHKGKATENINFPWARAFNKRTLKEHAKKHGKEFGCNNEQEYEAKALHFANMVDRKHFKSFVDRKGTTYKYDPRTNVMVEVDKRGIIISYRHYGKSFWYINKKGEKVWIS